MNSKALIWIGMFLGSVVGSYIPTLWGDNFLSFSSVVFSGIFALVGIWLGFKISNYLE